MGTAGEQWSGESSPFPCCSDSWATLACFSLSLSLCEHQLNTLGGLMLRNAPKRVPGTQNTSKTKTLLCFKIIYSHTKITMSFLLKPRFKTLQCHLHATKKKGSRQQWTRGEAIWGSQEGKRNARVMLGPRQPHGSSLENLRPATTSSCTRHAQRSVFDEKEDRFQLPTATNKTLSVSAEVESMLFQ